MNTSSLFIALVFLLLSKLSLQESNEQTLCSEGGNGAGSLKLSLNGTRNSTGDWVTDFSARKEICNSSRNMNVEIEHKIFECDGKTVIHMKGSSREQYKGGSSTEKFLFHEKCGTNARIINERRSAFRINPDIDNAKGTLLSSRPLNDDELFEVRLDNRLSKWGKHSIGVGVTANPINSLSLSHWMMEMKSNTWMMYDKDIYVNGNKKLDNYGEDLMDLQVGDRVGVKRTSNGELHVFINGVDQGVAASDVPGSVHGVIDLIRDFISVTIV